MKALQDKIGQKNREQEQKMLQLEEDMKKKQQ